MKRVGLSVVLSSFLLVASLGVLALAARISGAQGGSGPVSSAPKTTALPDGLSGPRARRMEVEGAEVEIGPVGRYQLFQGRYQDTDRTTHLTVTKDVILRLNTQTGETERYVTSGTTASGNHYQVWEK